MPRFVVLRHEVPAEFARGSHFDLMFEVDGALRTWAVDELPRLDGPAVAATPLPHHRIAYLDYEGPVSNGRGTVHRIARGTCRQIAGSACLPERNDSEKARSEEARSEEASPRTASADEASAAADARAEFEIESPELRGRMVFTAQEVRLKSLSG